AGGRRDTEVGDDHDVVLLGVGELRDRLAYVLVELARDERLRVERHVADRAPRAVEMRRDSEAVNAAGRAREHRGRAPHAQSHAQRAERGAHALRLVVRARRVVLGIALAERGVAGGDRRGLETLLPAMAAADG